MKIFVKVKTRKREYVEKTDDTHFVVATKEIPVEGRANEALIRILAEYFHQPKSAFWISHGKHSKQKTIEWRPGWRRDEIN